MNCNLPENHGRSCRSSLNVLCEQGRAADPRLTRAPDRRRRAGHAGRRGAAAVLPGGARPPAGGRRRQGLQHALVAFSVV